MAWITDLYNRMDSFKDVIGVKLNYLNAQLATKVNLNGGNATGNLASAISRQHDAVTLGSNSTGLFLAAQVISLAAGYAIPTVAQINNWNDPYTSGENITIQSDKSVDMRFENNSWIRSKDGKPRIYFGSGGSTTDDTFFKRGYLGGEFWFLDADDSPLMKIGAGGVMRIYQLAGTNNRLLMADLSGSIFATNINPDDIATETWANGRFSLLGHMHPISDIVGLQSALDGKVTSWDNVLAIGLHSGNFNAPFFYHSSGTYINLATQDWVNSGYAPKNSVHNVNTGQYAGNVDSLFNTTTKLFNATGAKHQYGAFVRFADGDIGSQPYNFAFNSASSKNGALSVQVSGDGGLGDWFDIWTQGNFDPNTKANVDGSNLVNIANWQSALGIVNYGDFRDYGLGTINSLLVTNNTHGLMNGFYRSQSGNINSFIGAFASVYHADWGGGYGQDIIIGDNGRVAVGFSSPNNTTYQIKELATQDWVSSIGVGNYVQKTGDTMSGFLGFGGNTGIHLNSSQWGITYSSNYSGINFVRYGFTDGVFFIHNNENVGVGTIDPLYKFDVVGQVGLHGVQGTNLSTTNKQLVQPSGNTVYFGNPQLSVLNFESVGTLIHYRNGVLGEVWTQHNFSPSSYVQNWDVASAIGFISSNTTDPYFYHNISGAFVLLATKDWVINNFIQPSQLGNYLKLDGTSTMQSFIKFNNGWSSGGDINVTSYYRFYNNGNTPVSFSPSGQIECSPAISSNEAVTLGQLLSYNFLTSFTETDPTVPSHVKGISTSDIAYWNAKFTFPGGGSPNQYINYQGVWTNLPGGGGGITNIATDDPNMPGPTASNMTINFNSHVAYGRPPTDINDEIPGNMEMVVETGDVVRIYGSYDNTYFETPPAGSTFDIDIDGIKKHIYNIVFQTSGSGSSTVRFGAGLYSGDQVNITVPNGQQIIVQTTAQMITPYGNGGAFECNTHANFIWHDKEQAWALVAYN